MRSILSALAIYSFGFITAMSVGAKIHLQECIPESRLQEERTKELKNFIVSADKHLNDSEATRYAVAYLDAEKEFDVNAFLLASIGRIESNFKPARVSEMGAIGLQQIMPVYWVKEIPFVEKASDLFVPEINIRASAYIVAHYRTLCGEKVEQIATCYHGGPRAIHRPMYTTIDYTLKVVKTFSTANVPSVYARSF